jgi:hypothetical protein
MTPGPLLMRGREPEFCAIFPPLTECVPIV